MCNRLRTTPREPDAAAVAQSFADGREALYCRQARAWFVWDGAVWPLSDTLLSRGRHDALRLAGFAEA